MLRRIKSERPHAGLVESVADWSARNRTAAIAAWLLLVVVAVLSTSLLPGDQVRSTEPGEAGRGQRMVSAQDAGDSIRENVMIRAGAGRAPETRRAVTNDLLAALRAIPGAVRDVGSPLGAHGGRWVSGDGTADLVTFEIMRPGRRVRHPQTDCLRRRREGGAPAPRGTPRPGRGLQLGVGGGPGHQGRHEAGGDDVAAPHRRHPARRLRLARRRRDSASAVGDRRRRRVRAAGHARQVGAVQQRLLRDRAAHRHGRGHRLLAVLSAPYPRGTRGRAAGPGGAADRVAHLGPRGGGVRSDGDGVHDGPAVHRS